MFMSFKQYLNPIDNGSKVRLNYSFIETTYAILTQYD